MVLYNKNQVKLDQSVLSEAVKVLSSLSNEDAVKIFVEANLGIVSSTETIRKIGITQKRYYVWLKRLIEAGLITKQSDTYIQTMFGKFCSRIGDSLLNAISQRGQLELADKLMRLDMLSFEEKEEVIKAISKTKIHGPADLSDILYEVKMITRYEKFLEELSIILEKAEKRVLIAVKSIDTKILEVILRVLKRRVQLSIISTESGFSDSVNPLRILLNSKSTESIEKILNTNEFNFKLSKNIAYSFFVIDDKNGMIILSNPKYEFPSSDDFYVAFMFRNPVFCNFLSENFKLIYEEGIENKQIGLIKKFLS
jgi:predicted transcriptional regulator